MKQGDEVRIVAGHYAGKRGQIHRAWGLHAWLRLHNQYRGVGDPKFVRCNYPEIRLADAVTRLGSLVAEEAA